MGGRLRPRSLDGPIAEMEGYSVPDIGNKQFAPFFMNAEGGKSYYGWYDVTSSRAHIAAGNDPGYLDGPFGRARFGGWHAGWYPATVRSSNGRYLYVTDNIQGSIYLRYLDFQTQQVGTILKGLAGFNGMAIDSQGRLYLHLANQIRVINADGTLVRQVDLDMSQVTTSGFRRFFPVTLDEVNNRFYSAVRRLNWYLWYWDLADGSFHGVVPISAVQRGRNMPGPFEGTHWYGEASTIDFGPDDPQKRYLYITHIDTYSLHRVDQERRVVSALLKESGLIRFSDTDWSKEYTYGSFQWVGHDFMGGSHSPPRAHYFKRVQ